VFTYLHNASNCGVICLQDLLDVGNIIIMHSHVALSFAICVEHQM